MTDRHLVATLSREVDILRRQVEALEKRLSSYVDLIALRSRDLDGAYFRIRDMEDRLYQLEETE